jgi:hypothetical protein
MKNKPYDTGCIKYRPLEATVGQLEKKLEIIP